MKDGRETLSSALSPGRPMSKPNREVSLAAGPRIAHDIRNCIAPLANALALIRLLAGDNPRVVQAIEMAVRQIDALNKLADEVEKSEAVTDVIPHPKPRTDSTPVG